ncbi:RNA polymerase III transcription factor IIIC subunit-domain-containing protein [Halteromyces radiatus]|uniref:RNA polymerase III transcription factor IIIC subunit-domain-containing protein n=1 Tax=Halteromyces radiatus TaxID=101107 RepID=UPI00221EC3D9|nr:RNA polymerase III transcription factor IIIC subunit-domain-containing protein [Halteromyces radiatus]KAI8083091.1 RNA polymerase III transcription factor IIIC subunit-domain-containing protein [Halteromyces radiatus]
MESTTSEKAPIYPVGNRKFFCVEYPGVVKNIDRVLQTFGGEKAVSQVYKNKENNVLELRYRPNDPFCHTINGSIVPSSRVLVKVTRRRRKDQPEDPGQITTELIGTIPQTCRFRGMADFQYLVPKDDPSRKLRSALVTGDTKSILDYKVSLNDDDMNNLRNIPPPVFTNAETPFKYEYKQNAPVTRIRVLQPDGTYVTKLVNLSTTNSMDRTIISFETNKIPTKPPSSKHLFGDALELKEKMEQLYEDRPIWSKHALRSRMNVDDDKYFMEALASIAYSFQNGPWRDCWVKYGVDPKEDQRYAMYQQVDIRMGHATSNTASNKRYVRAKRNRELPVFANEQEQQDPSSSTENDGVQTPSYIFDGHSIPTRSSWYQVCDITDPDFDCILRSSKYLHSGPPTKRHGFYYASAFEAARNALRQKHQQLMETGQCVRMPNMDKGLDDKIQKDKDTLVAQPESSSAATTTVETDRPTERYGIDDDTEMKALESGDSDDDDDAGNLVRDTDWD